ncbi:hypothetical protein EMGBS15_14390 [Filimonas sp.]|nr:hypothetical protein EMGBS15_14390 [Filimonas sp.]
MNNINLFEGRRLLVATKHGKEQVIAPILESALGVICVLPSNLDTDVLGTLVVKWIEWRIR